MDLPSIHAVGVVILALANVTGVNMNKQRRIIKKIAHIIGCKQCGRKTALLYHHREPLDKSFNVGREAHRFSIVTLMAEIEKCDILCRSCHQKIHLPGYKRKFVYPCIGYWQVHPYMSWAATLSFPYTFQGL